MVFQKTVALMIHFYFKLRTKKKHTKTTKTTKFIVNLHRKQFLKLTDIESRSTEIFLYNFPSIFSWPRNVLWVSIWCYINSHSMLPRKLPIFSCFGIHGILLLHIKLLDLELIANMMMWIDLTTGRLSVSIFGHR